MKIAMKARWGIVSILIVSLFSSCAPIPYLPVHQTIPLVKKNEIVSTGSVTLPNPLYGLGVRGIQMGAKASVTYGATDLLRVHGSVFSTLDSRDLRQSVSLGVGNLFPLSSRTYFSPFIIAEKAWSTSQGEWLLLSRSYDYDFSFSSLSLQAQLIHVTPNQNNLTLTSRFKKLFIGATNDDISRSGYLVEPAVSFTTCGSKLSYTFELGSAVYPEDILGSLVITGYLSIGVNYCLTCNN